MDIASLVLGIISIVFNFFCGIISIITAPIGLILGIIDLNTKNKENNQNKGMAIAGIVLCSISLIIVLGIFIILFSIGSVGY